VKQRAGGGVKVWLRVLAPVLISLAGLTSLRLLGPDMVNQQDLRAWLAPFGQWAPAAFVFFLAVRPVTLLPGQLFTAVGGMLFGTLPATVYSLMGSFLAFGLIYGLSRWLGTRLMKRMVGGRYQVLKRVAKRHGFKYSVLVTINPLLPTDMMLAAALASGARFWPVAAGVVLGTLPGTFLTAQFGSGLAQGRTVMTVVSAVGLVVSLVLGAVLGRRIFQEINAETEDSPEAAQAPSEKREEPSVRPAPPPVSRRGAQVSVVPGPSAP